MGANNTNGLPRRDLGEHWFVLGGALHSTLLGAQEEAYFLVLDQKMWMGCDCFVVKYNQSHF